jgi:Eco29kI restriction endonuclease
MAMRPPDTLAMERLETALAEVVELAKTASSNAVASRIRRELQTFSDKLEDARAATDKVLLPRATFDPFEPKTVGRMVALAMLAQPLVPLSAVPDAYGSGIYAIYYFGDHPFYTAISGTETPIYVGKADPAIRDASSPREQGIKLSGRLREHAGRISDVERYAAAGRLPPELHSIRLQDFKCRRLTCATNAQLVAETHLIGMFWPLWNSQTKACWGLSKHGDAAGTRKNKRSPWDVVHPGRNWALSETLEDSLRPATIKARIDEVLRKTPPRTDHAALLSEILEIFSQDQLLPVSLPLVSPLGSEVEGPAQDEAGEEDE